jgi:hypothetical protein
MLKLHPKILEKDGKREFAVLSWAEFEQVTEALQDLADLQELRQAKAAEKDLPTLSLSEVREQFGR